MATQINNKTVRAALAPSREPYWSPVGGAGVGRYLGYRKMPHKDQPGVITSETWIARARDQHTKKQQYHSLGELSDALDFETASKAARKWFAELDAGVKTKDRATVEDACRAYVEDREKVKGPRTASDANWRFTKYVYGTPFGNTELSKLHTPTLKAWRASLGMTKAGENRMMAGLRAALNLAVENRLVSSTVAIEWKLVKQHKDADGRREIFLDMKQRRALLEASTGAVRDLLEAAMLTGARPGELGGAPCGAWDSRLKTLKLDGKTGARTVSLALSPDAVKLFNRVSKSKRPDDPLLARDDGKPWTRADWTEEVRAAAAAAKVSNGRKTPSKLPVGVCMYTLRHSFITEAIDKGKPLKAVADFTGTSLAMIQKHYGQKTGAVAEVAEVRML